MGVAEKGRLVVGGKESRKQGKGKGYGDSGEIRSLHFLNSKQRYQKSFVLILTVLKNID